MLCEFEGGGGGGGAHAPHAPSKSASEYNNVQCKITIRKAQ